MWNPIPPEAKQYQVLPLLPLPRQYYPESVYQYFEIEQQGGIFGIQQVKFHAFHHFFNGGGIAKLHHAPACKFGFYLEQKAVKGVDGLKFFNEISAFGSRAHKAHFAFQDIPALGQFVLTSYI